MKYNKPTLWEGKAIHLTILNELPAIGDTLIAFKPVYLRALNNNIISLNQFREKANLLIDEQQQVIFKQQEINALKDEQLELRSKELQVHVDIEKDMRKGFRKKVIGISVGSVSVGVSLGLILPYVLAK